MSPAILHLIDTLEVGGAERVAVHLVNLLPRERYRPFLATTRHEGLLAADVADDVGRFCMARKCRFDLSAFLRLRRWVRTQEIRLIHAHASGLLVGVLAKLLCPELKLVWHDHCGFADRHSPVWLYRRLCRRVDAVIVVKKSLAEFAHDALGVPAERVVCLPNFVPVIPSLAPCAVELPGTAPKRVVCVANLRPQKDHLTLLRAWVHVVQEEPRAHLLVVGGEADLSYSARVRQQTADLGLQDSVTFLGQRGDVPAILGNAAIGVLSSRNEGFPVSLLEYGVAGLAVVATDVGECSGVLDHGRAGLLVATGDARALADALRRLLQDSALRQELGGRLQVRVRDEFSPTAVVRQVESVYRRLLGAE